MQGAYIGRNVNMFARKACAFCGWLVKGHFWKRFLVAETAPLRWPSVFCSGVVRPGQLSQLGARCYTAFGSLALYRGIAETTTAAAANKHANRSRPDL